VEPLEQKRDIARQLGADLLLNPGTDDVRTAVMDLTGVGADVVIECAGRRARCGSPSISPATGGTVEFFGVCPIGETIPVEPNQVYFKELTILGLVCQSAYFCAIHSSSGIGHSPRGAADGREFPPGKRP